jgi:hypothetical protein
MNYLIADTGKIRQFNPELMVQIDLKLIKTFR